MKFQIDEVIKKLYEEQKENFPDLSHTKFREICRNSLNLIKDSLENPLLPTVKIRHFGSFAVYEGKIKEMLARNEAGFKGGHRKEARYLEAKRWFEEVLEFIQERRIIDEPKIIYLTDDTEDTPTVQEIEPKLYPHRRRY
jgi:nucleoid DNA-binding protein